MVSYTRRGVLLAGVAASASLVGCLGDGGPGDGTPTDGTPTRTGGTPARTDEQDGTPTDDGTPEDEGVNPADVHWTYDVGGTVDAVANGLVLAREDFDEGTGGIVALDAASGDQQWTYGETGGYTLYTLPTVGDGAVYTGYGDDAIGSGNGTVQAVGFDGNERWTEATGSVYHPPRLDDGAVFVGDDASGMHSFDADTGGKHWTLDLSEKRETPEPLSVDAVVDGRAYVTGDEVAWAIEDGEVAWSYEPDAGRISSTAVGALVYCDSAGQVDALDEDEAVWSVNGTLQAVTDDALYVRQQTELCAFDPATGDELWCVDHPEDVRVAIGEDLVYVGADEVRAVDDGGDEVWAVAPEGGAVESLVVADDVYAVTAGAVSRIRDGDVAASASVAGVRSLVVDDGVYAATRDAMFGIAL